MANLNGKINCAILFSIGTLNSDAWKKVQYMLITESCIRHSRQSGILLYCLNKPIYIFFTVGTYLWFQTVQNKIFIFSIILETEFWTFLGAGGPCQNFRNVKIRGVTSQYKDLCTFIILMLSKVSISYYSLVDWWSWWKN